MEGADDLLARLSLGREEYCQRLLTQLVLAADYPRWGTASSPSESGVRFLRLLDDASFGSSDWGGPPLFVDELDLPRRHDDERGGAPDQACLWPDRLWMIELKTEVGSHRPGQLAAYFELARHHHPGLQLDITYLTPAMPTTDPRRNDGDRFAHVSWDAVRPLARQVWGDGSPGERDNLEGLESALAGLGTPWPVWRAERLAGVIEAPQGRRDLVAEAVGLARLTGEDGEQRALKADPASLDDLQELRLAVREAIVALPEDDSTHRVRPWLWCAETSGGTAMTEGGGRDGYELRLSRYQRPVTRPGAPGRDRDDSDER